MSGRICKSARADVPAPSGFTLESRKNGQVVITHLGKVAAIVRGRTAERLIDRIQECDDLGAQHLMARATGNYRRGNERTSSTSRRGQPGSAGQQEAELS